MSLIASRLPTIFFLLLIKFAIRHLGRSLPTVSCQRVNLPLGLLVGHAGIHDMDISAKFSGECLEKWWTISLSLLSPSFPFLSFLSLLLLPSAIPLTFCTLSPFSLIPPFSLLFLAFFYSSLSLLYPLYSFFHTVSPFLPNPPFSLLFLLSLLFLPSNAFLFLPNSPFLLSLFFPFSFS